MNGKIRGACAGAFALLGLVASASQPQAQQKTEISLSRQPGIYYMPTHIIEKQKLIEKHAALLGVPNVTTKSITSPAAARRPTRSWPVASIFSTQAPATCCCCGIARAAASRASSPARPSRWR